ncbi:MAG: hypothetical protein AB1730_09400 [Myxococcota bacterium]
MVLLEVASTATHPVELRPALGLILGFGGGQTLDELHPMLNAFQALWDSAGPVAKARHVAREPHAGAVHLTAPFEPGHHVSFDVARRQRAAFVLRAGCRTAKGPSIVAARGIDDACPYLAAWEASGEDAGAAACRQHGCRLARRDERLWVQSGPRGGVEQRE